MFSRVLPLCPRRRAETRLVKLRDKPLAARSCRTLAEIILFIRRFDPSCISPVLFSMHGSILHVSVLVICTSKLHSKNGLPGFASGEQRQITLFLTLPISSRCPVYHSQSETENHLRTITASLVMDERAREAAGSITHQTLLGEFRSLILSFRAVDAARDSTLL